MIYYLGMGLLAYLLATLLFLSLFIAAARADRVLQNPPAKLIATPPRWVTRRVHRKACRASFRMALR